MIWNAASLADADIPEQHRLSLGEGSTPLEPMPSLADLWLKREDCNPTGSHKDRAAAFQLAAAAARGAAGVVVSSSGNAGIATARYAELHGLPAIVCVDPRTDPAKLRAIGGRTTLVLVTPRAINSAKRIALEFGIPNLRPSVSDDALVAYATIADEVLDIEFDAFVLFATSGATVVGVAETLHAAGHRSQVHFVQGHGNDRLASRYGAGLRDVAPPAGQPAAAGHLGVRSSRRAERMWTAVDATGGRGWSVDAGTIDQGLSQLASAGIVAGRESAANFTVARDLVARGLRTVCLISGATEPPQPETTRLVEVSDEWQAVAAVEQALGLCRRERPDSAPSVQSPA